MIGPNVFVTTGGLWAVGCWITLNLFEHIDIPHKSVDHSLHQVVFTGIWSLSTNIELDVLKYNHDNIDPELQSTTSNKFFNIEKIQILDIQGMTKNFHKVTKKIHNYKTIKLH